MTYGRGPPARPARPPICSGIVGGNDDDGPSNGQRAVAPQQPEQLRPVLPALVGDSLLDPLPRRVQEDHLVGEEPVGGERTPRALDPVLAHGKAQPGVLDGERLAALRPAHHQEPRQLVDRVAAGPRPAEHRQGVGHVLANARERLRIDPFAAPFDQLLFERARAQRDDEPNDQDHEKDDSERAERIPEHLDWRLERSGDEQEHADELRDEGGERRPGPFRPAHDEAPNASASQSRRRGKARARRTPPRRSSRLVPGRVGPSASAGDRRGEDEADQPPSSRHLRDGDGLELLRRLVGRVARGPEESAYTITASAATPKLAVIHHFGGGGTSSTSGCSRLVGLGKSSSTVSSGVGWMLRSTRWRISPQLRACCVGSSSAYFPRNPIARQTRKISFTAPAPVAHLVELPEEVDPPSGLAASPRKGSFAHWSLPGPLGRRHVLVEEERQRVDRILGVLAVDPDSGASVSIFCNGRGTSCRNWA